MTTKGLSSSRPSSKRNWPHFERSLPRSYERGYAGVLNAAMLPARRSARLELRAAHLYPRARRLWRLPDWLAGHWLRKLAAEVAEQWEAAPFPAASAPCQFR